MSEIFKGDSRSEGRVPQAIAIKVPSLWWYDSDSEIWLKSCRSATNKSSSSSAEEDQLSNRSLKSTAR